jgi:hypothetical protein
MKTILNFTKIVCLLAVFFLQQNINAQAPNKMSYQAVVRNASNALVASAPVGMKISILQGSASGTAVYEESHTATTNANGLATIEIGSGTVISGTMAGINWAAGPYFLKTETDPAGGTAYSISGTSELMSVPYAKFAESSGAWTTAAGVTSNSNDNIGIGTTTPLTKLHVSTANSNVATFDGGNQMWLTLAENGFERGYIGSFAGNAEDVELGTYNNNSTGAVHLTTNNTPRLTVVNNGNVGIGTTTPDFPLSFPTTFGDKISLFGNAAARVGFGVQPGNFQMLGDFSGTDLTFGYGLSASPVELMRIKSNTGNVGIGTSSPTSKLNVNGQITIDQKNFGGYGGLLIKGDAPNSNYPNICFSIKNNAATPSDEIAGYIGGNINSNVAGAESMDLSFLTSQSGQLGLSERLRIKDNGNIGVGTITPTAKLEVNGGTKLGSNAPAVKMLKFTGTTGSSQGAQTLVPHGLTFSKILAVNVLVQYAPGLASVPPSYNINPGYEFDYYVSSTDIVVWTKPGNSAVLLSVPFTILVTYEE